MSQNNNSEPKKTRNIKNGNEKFFVFHAPSSVAESFVKGLGAKKADVTLTIPYNGHYIVFDTPNRAFSQSRITKNFPLSIRAKKKSKGEYNFAIHTMHGDPRSTPVYTVKPDVKAALNAGFDSKMSPAEKKLITSAADVIVPLFETDMNSEKFSAAYDKSKFEIDVINSTVAPYRKNNEKQEIPSLIIVRQLDKHDGNFNEIKDLIEISYGLEIYDVENINFAMRRYNTMVLNKGFDIAEPYAPVIEKSKLPSPVINETEIKEAVREEKKEKIKTAEPVKDEAKEESAKPVLTERQEKIVAAVKNYLSNRDNSFMTLSDLHDQIDCNLRITKGVLRNEVLKIQEIGELETNKYVSNQMCISVPYALPFSKKEEAEKDCAGISKRGKLMFGELVYQQHVQFDGTALPLVEFAAIVDCQEILSRPAVYLNVDKMPEYIAKEPTNKRGFMVSVKSMPADFETDYASYGFDDDKFAAYKKSIELFKGEAKFICHTNQAYEDMKERLVRNAEKIADKGSVTGESNVSPIKFDEYPTGTFFKGNEALVMNNGAYTHSLPKTVFSGVKEDDAIKFSVTDAKGRKAELAIVCDATVSYADDNSPYASRIITVSQNGGRQSLLDAVIDYKTTSNHITHRLIDAVIKPADMPEPQIRGRKPALI